MPFFTYNRDVPDAPNNPSVDQPDMKTNTNNTDDLIFVDHFSFNVNTGGTHKKVTLTDAAAPAIPAGTSAIFHSNTVAGLSWPFWKNSAGDFQMMGVNSPTTNGYVFLPAGIIIQWGSITGAPIANGAAVAFPTSFTNIFSVTLGPVSNSTNDKTINITTGSVNVAGFTVITSGSSSFTKLYWMAIGN